MRTDAFWRFSLGLYAEDGVEAACLALQAAGANVNLLLLCCWLGKTGRCLQRRRLRQLVGAVAAWQAQVVRPLRQVRRDLKAESWRVARRGRVELRRCVAAAELEAERLEQLLLAGLVADLPRQPGKKFAQENLLGYGALLGLGAGAGAHLSVLLGACGPLVRPC